MPDSAFNGNTAICVDGVDIRHILTCAHVLRTKDEKKKISIYFVPYRSLHISGWPQPNLVAAPYSTEKFISFLENHPESFYLNEFMIKRKGTNPQSFSQHTQPQHFRSEDAALAKISYRSAQPKLYIQELIKIKVVTNHPSHLMDLQDTGRSYFAIGFPGMHHHLTSMYILAGEPAPYKQWIDSRGKSPLIVSCAQAQKAPNTYPNLYGGDMIQHVALTGAGMSGGSLLSIKPAIAGELPCIEIFGIIRSGNTEESHACIW